MDLKTFDFPGLSGRTIKTDPELLAEAKERGFYNGHTDHNTLFNKLFFGGGELVWKSNVDPEFKAKAWPYCRAFMQSYEPRHEDKEAICSMLMSELLVAKKN